MQTQHPNVAPSADRVELDPIEQAIYRAGCLDAQLELLQQDAAAVAKRMREVESERNALILKIRDHKATKKDMAEEPEIPSKKADAADGTANH